MRPNPELKVETARVDELIPYAGNAKLHPRRQVDQIAASIAEFGNCDPIAVWHNDDGDMEIVEGHGRLMALNKLGIETCPVITLDHLSDEQRRAYALVHNKLTMNTDFDDAVLEIELGNIDLDMEAFGFDPSDVADESVDLWPDAERDDVFARELGEADFYQIAENACVLARDWGCGMWGMSINGDPLAYDEFKPFRTLAYIDGGTVGYVRDDGIRYDEALTVKEDVDYFLQSVRRYHKALRIEKYFPKKGSFTNAGGNQTFRTPELEKEQFQAMQRKWGSNVIRPNAAVAKNTSKIRGHGGAIRVNLPYEGV